VTLKVGEVDGRETRHLSGVIHCNRVMCPTCAAFVTARRLDLLRPLAERNAQAGHHVFLTLTMRHRLGVEWADLRNSVKSAWRRVFKRRRFAESVLGGVRQDESTWGENGHHFHIHVLLTLDPTVVPAEFAQWFREAFEKVAQESGRTCDWKDEWWSLVSPDRLAATVGYTQKAGEGLDHLVGAELLGGWAKHGSRLWDLPPDVYAEVWRASMRNRWFSSFGIWKSEKAEELEDEETLEADREQVGQEERSIPVRTWKLVPSDWLDWLLGVVLNREVPRAEALRHWDVFWAAFAQTDTPTPSG
jgi:REP element-mobilizing transposase RayT